MSVDYDLLVIGNTPAAVQTATTAANLKARVAWVTQRSTTDPTPDVWLPALSELGHKIQQSQQLTALPLWKETVNLPAQDMQWNRVNAWIRAIATNLNSLKSFAVLASLGVDAIEACGEFCRKPSPGFMVERRFIRARAYLIAVPAKPALPEIPGLSEVAYTTLSTLLQQLPRWQSGDRVAILGGDRNAISLSQTLAHFGFAVTLILPTASLLPHADPNIEHLLQAQLEVDGVQVMRPALVTQVKPVQSAIWLQAGEIALETDHLVVATQATLEVDNLNLEAVRVQRDATGILRNDKLQTTNRSIYLCAGQVKIGQGQVQIRQDSVAQTDYFPQIAAHEAAIALQNALFFPRLRASYRTIPLTLPTSPTLAWIGMTESEAVQRYGKQVLVIRQPFHPLPRAQFSSDLTGLSQWVVHPNGTLLGAQVVGAQAAEWIGVIALAMQQNLKIDALASLALPSPTFAEIISQNAIAAQHQRLKKKPWLRDGFDLFFDWQRYWTR